MRLIDADALITEIATTVSKATIKAWEIGTHTYIETLDRIAERQHEIIDMIDKAPTITPADIRPQGRWEEICNDYGELEGWLHVDCGRESKSKDKYCGTCGAKMDGKENEDA